MALSRARRSNAGSKMALLLNTMEADDFYTTTYGGFNEDEADDEFICEAKPITEDTQADVDDDIVDSDFSIDENDEPRSDVENSDDPDKPKRAKRALGVQTKAYKEPKRDQPPKPKKPRVVSSTSVSDPRIDTTPRPKFKRDLTDTAGRKLTRASTVSKTVETVKRQRERALKAKKLLKKKMALKKISTNHSLTQDDLLEEAKETEKLNIESLKKFQQMEIEAKQQAIRASKRSVQGPFVQYRSTAMPLSQIIPKKTSNMSGSEDKICVDDSEDLKDPSSEDEKLVDEDLQERTFLTFSDFDTFRNSFPQRKPREPQQKICPITRLPAKYFDPVTRLPYANLQAFRILREAYYSQLELKGDKNDPEVAAWMEWRLKNKPAKPPIISQMNRPQVPFSHLLSNVTPVTTMNRVATPVALTTLSATLRHPTTTIVMTTSAQPTIIQTTRTIMAAQQPIQHQQQQSIVLPPRTTPLAQQPPISVSQLLQTSQAALVHATATLPTQPTTTGLQTVKIGGQPTQVSLTGNTRTLTAQQLQQFSALRGNSLASIQNALRASGITTGPRTQLIARPSVGATVSPSAMLRPQTVSGQVTLQHPQQSRSHTIALQRPAGGLTTQTIALQPAGVRAGTGQILVAPSGGTATRQQIVVASPGQHGVTRQIVMTTQGGGTPVRSGQILQVTGQQHQIVVSPSGQIILNHQANKQQ